MGSGEVPLSNLDQAWEAEMVGHKCESMMKVGNVEIAQIEDAATIVFAYSPEMVAAIKQGLPTARWNAHKKVWQLNGKTAFVRAVGWANSLTERLHEFDVAAALKFRWSEFIDFNPVGFGGTSRFRLSFAYSKEAVAIARRLPGAKFDASTKCWSFEPRSVADVDLIVAGFKDIKALGLKKTAPSSSSATFFPRPRSAAPSNFRFVLRPEE